MTAAAPDPRPAPAPSGGATAAIARRASFDLIRYGSVWEDADVLCAALAPVASKRRLLSIASAGDNALALLTLDPSEVVAVDVSAAQLACVALRMAAFRKLDDDALLAFLGVTASTTRVATYAGLRTDLQPDAARFWDARRGAIARGIVHAGRFERYFHLFRRWVLPLVHGRGTVEALREPRLPAERERFYAERWDGWRWRALFRLFFGRAVMGRLGRDPAFFDHVEAPVGERLLERSRHALTRLPVATNPYLAYILTGNFPLDALPRYLRPEHRETIRRRLGRLSLAHGAIEASYGNFDGFNLSDVFEYMSPAEHEAAYARVVSHARRGARLVYWNLLAPRSRPAALADRVRPLAVESEALHARDLAWFYSRLHIDEVVA